MHISLQNIEIDKKKHFNYNNKTYNHSFTV